MTTEYPVKKMFLIKLNGKTGHGKQELVTMTSLDQAGLPLSWSLGDSNMPFCFVPLTFILHPLLSWEVDFWRPEGRKRLRVGSMFFSLPAQVPCLWKWPDPSTTKGPLAGPWEKYHRGNASLLWGLLALPQRRTLCRLCGSSPRRRWVMGGAAPWCPLWLPGATRPCS